MLKRLFVFFLCLVFSVAVLGGIMFGVDYHRLSNLESPCLPEGHPKPCTMTAAVAPIRAWAIPWSWRVS